MIIQVPSSALKELQQLEESDWSVSGQDLVEWVNSTAERFLPADKEAKSGRVSDSLSLRTMRHYQTLGCIDPPVRDGREARYGFRHYLQTLLVRKLLWQRVPSEKIATQLSSKTTSEYKSLLLENIEWTVQSPPPGEASPQVVAEIATWKRVQVAPGVEIHLQEEFCLLDARTIPALLEKIEAALRGALQRQNAK